MSAVDEQRVASNTGENSEKKPGQFVKGDARINRKGRPKSFDALRELAQQIAHEAATKERGEPLVISGHVATIAEMILRSWAMSKNPQLSKAFLEVAFGKVPDELKIDLGKLSDAELLEAVGPILARLGISLVAPDEKRVQGDADIPSGDGGGEGKAAD